MIGQILGNYKITQKIGAGGQGTVYKAIDQRLGRTVVVKVLPPELTVKEANLKRFEREARLASSLDHPNICTIFDMDEAGGLHFITMQYVEGRNVRQLVNGRPLELESALLACLEKSRAKRPQTARDLAALISRCAEATAWSIEDSDAWWGRHERGVASGIVSAPAAAPPDRTAARGHDMTIDQQR